MHRDFDTLFDALLACRMDWEAARQHYRSSAALHLRSGLDVVGGRPDVLAGIAADVIRFCTALEQLSRCMLDVDDVLQLAQDMRSEAGSDQQPGSTGGPPQGDGGAS